jgi:DNA-binding NarL/FixJ family response regulator
VLLLDWLMPGIDGIETLNKISAVQPNQRIIVMTAYFKDDEILEAVRDGVSAYVRKDTPPENLIQCIREVCAGERTMDLALTWQLRKEMSAEDIDRERLVLQSVFHVTK